MMCGGGKKSTPAPQPSPIVGYSYSPADMSNQRKQALAVAPNAGAQSSYGSELGTQPAPAAAPSTGGM